MINGPQLEDGFTRIANEILEALARTPLSGAERRILDVVLRKTYGWGEKDARISYRYFAKATGMSKSNCANIAKRLANKKVLLRVDTYPLTYRFNKHYDEWKTSTNRVDLSTPGVDRGTTTGGQKGTAYAVPQIKEKKETINKETYAHAFEIAWSVYPRKRSKAAAERAHRSHLKSEVQRNRFLRAIAYLQKAVDDGIRPVDKCPYMATWLNSGDWENWIDQIPPDEYEHKRSKPIATIKLEKL